MSNQSVTFQSALDTVETLPDDQQENLVEIIHHRLTDRRRQEMAENIQTAKYEYARGEVKRGSVDDLLGELAE